MTNTTTEVVERTYHGSGKTYWTVECRACGIVLNSGHHYQDGQHHHAVELAEQHNEAVHGQALCEVCLVALPHPLGSPCVLCVVTG